MIKNYIFDFGNVLCRFEPDELSAPYIADSAARAAVVDAVFDRAYWDKLDSGSITDEDTIAGFCSRLPDEFHSPARDIFANWINNLPPIQGMPQLVSDIKAQGGKLYLLSNISVRFADTYKDVPWLDELFSNFDGLVFSGPLGLTKPNKEIFDHLLSRFALSADECIFIDDSAANLEGAKEVGIQGYLFDGDAQKLREFLSES